MAERLAAPASVAVRTHSFDDWMIREQKRIYWLCRRMLEEADDADCATQEVFLKAYRALRDGGSEPDEPEKWLTRIAVNVCLDRLRSRRWQFWKRRPDEETENTILVFAEEPGPSPEDRVFAAEIHNRLRKALRQLSGRQRAVFALRHFEQKSLEEIAAILGVDVGTVKAHMSRALSKLREELKDLYAPVGARRHGRPATGGGEGREEEP